MMNIKLLLMLFFSVATFTTCNAQGRYLRMVKNSNGKIRVFNENKRVKIKTLNGEKFIGKFTIIDDKTLLIKGVKLNLSDLKYIRNRSLGSAFAGAGIASYGGLLVLASPLLTVFGETTGAVILASVGSLIVLSGIFAHEIFPKNLKSKWTYTFVGL